MDHFKKAGEDKKNDCADGSAFPEHFGTSGMTLEAIVELTGEIGHLNELVMLHLEKAGGFTTTSSYFATVTPILDLLEVEIRVRYRPGMTQNELKLLVQDWIDTEIAGLRHCTPSNR